MGCDICIPKVFNFMECIFLLFLQQRINPPVLPEEIESFSKKENGALNANRGYWRKITSNYNRNGFGSSITKIQEVKNIIKKNGNNEIKTLLHSTYRRQYDIVFEPKYRRSLERLYTPFGINTTVRKCSTIHGISQGKKYIDDFRPTHKFKLQVWETPFLV